MRNAGCSGWRCCSNNTSSRLQGLGSCCYGCCCCGCCLNPEPCCCCCCCCLLLQLLLLQLLLLLLQLLLLLLLNVPCNGTAHTTGKSALTQTIQLLYAGAKVEQDEYLQAQKSCTIGADGWTDARKRSIFAFTAVTPGRDAFLLDTQDLSIIKHTASAVAGACTVLGCRRRDPAARRLRRLGLSTPADCRHRC